MVAGQFRLGTHSIPDAAVRIRLHRAILDADIETFHETLERDLPGLLGQNRLYGVLDMTAGEMQLILVDGMGKRVSEGYVISSNTPIDLLNVSLDAGYMTATDLNGEIWRAPIPTTFFQAGMEEAMT